MTTFWDRGHTQVSGKARYELNAFAVLFVLRGSQAELRRGAHNLKRWPWRESIPEVSISVTKRERLTAAQVLRPPLPWRRAVASTAKAPPVRWPLSAMHVAYTKINIAEPAARFASAIA